MHNFLRFMCCQSHYAECDLVFYSKFSTFPAKLEYTLLNTILTNYFFFFFFIYIYIYIYIYIIIKSCLEHGVLWFSFAIRLTISKQFHHQRNNPFSYINISGTVSLERPCPSSICSIFSLCLEMPFGTTVLPRNICTYSFDYSRDSPNL